MFFVVISCWYSLQFEVDLLTADVVTPTRHLLWVFFPFLQYLQEKMKKLEEEYADKEIPKPDYW